MPAISAATATRVAEIRPTADEAQKIKLTSPNEFFSVVEDAFQALLKSIKVEVEEKQSLQTQKPGKE
jgi:hypothetical protein